ncbi:L,D-transpeptidase [Ramlibacter tataouinensis]|uniref:L,D-transpeptidase n=1 Tax=Ramlibacter tataouinensis TaxID=94132 RepID=UPI0022F3AB44|nr:L,D-transpeptidase [Ramlibacter tataouinensis]WBY00966.1 L,D-transpeptidase [Ramlibacter tataouinensis]
MQWKGKAAALCAAWALACAAVAAAPAAGATGQGPQGEAQDMLRWVAASGDAQGHPFLIVDKKAARLYAFRPDGRLLAATDVLLGSAPGDHSVPGVGERAQSGTLAPQERTTPAGRFLTQPGRNLDGEHVIWFDYDAALAIHRLRPGRSHRLRAARLAGSQPHERRLSLGCVVVPVAFYLDVIEPLLGKRAGVVYVMPETGDARDLFMAL